MHIKYSLPADRLNAMKAAAAAKAGGKPATSTLVSAGAAGAGTGKASGGSVTGAKAVQTLSNLLNSQAFAVQSEPVAPQAGHDVAAAVSPGNGGPVLDGSNSVFNGTAVPTDGPDIAVQPPPRSPPKDPVIGVRFPLSGEPASGDAVVVMPDGTYLPVQRMTLS